MIRQYIKMIRGCRCVVFDLDGTITYPNSIDFARMRRRCGIPDSEDIIAHISKQELQAREVMLAIVHEEEEIGLSKTILRDDARETIASLHKRGIKLGILTRNSDEIMTKTLSLLGEERDKFDIAVSRSFQPSKPHAAPLLHISKTLGIPIDGVVMVGDHSDDILTGKNANAGATILIGDHDHPNFIKAKDLADFTITTLSQINHLLM